jgi:integrase/recombinase XerD
MKTRVNIILWRKAHKANAQGLAPISCRVSVDGKRAEISTSIRVAALEWNNAGKRVLGNSAKAKTANASLLKMVDQLTDIWADIERQGKRVRAADIARLYRAPGCVVGLLELCAAFQEERQSLVGIEVAQNTVNTATTHYNTLRQFLTTQGLTDLRPDEFTAAVADKLLLWLIWRGGKRNSANMAVQAVGQALRWAVRKGLLLDNPLRGYTYKKAVAGDIIYLEASEVAALTAIALRTPQLERARNCFLLQCWTGLAYADLKALNVARDAKTNPTTGRRVLYVKRQKSTMQKAYNCIIPLLPEAERILALYNDQPKPPTCEDYNELLKRLGTLCGIDAAKMKSHTGRRTAGTLLLNLGIPLPVVSSFLGHSNTLITQKHYAKLLDTTVVDAFDIVFAPARRVVLPVTPMQDFKMLASW